MKSTVLVPENGTVVSRPDFKPDHWLPTAVPSTVLSAFVKNGVYPDPRLALNAYRIPDSSDEFNRRHDLARFSYLPDQRNPWRDPYWFRAEFTLPKRSTNQRVWLHFDAINYRADVWLNGRPLADRAHLAGMFQRFQFDITDAARPGRNALAVKVWPVDHPGTPDTQLDVLGKDRGYVGKEIMRDVTEIMTIGYDCMMTVPDRNMGLWQPVWIEFTGPVDLRNPFVVTDLPLPETNRATLTISAELANASALPVKGVLRGSIAGTDVRFEQPVQLAANETKLVIVGPTEDSHDRNREAIGGAAMSATAVPPSHEPRSSGRESAPSAFEEKPEPTHVGCYSSGGSLAASPPRRLEPKLLLRNPRLWWPANYGEQFLYELKLEFVQTDSASPRDATSDTETVRFGVRKVGYEIDQRNGYHGRRVLINGQRIFCRGGYIQPELMFDWDARRMESEIRYYAAANLNLIYFEDIPNPPAPFLELCDRYGVLFGNVFYSCYWLRPGTPYPDDFALLESCTVDLVKRYRNHPSLIFYMAMNEEDTKENIYEMWRRHILALDGTRWFIPSAYFPSDRKNVPAWFKQDLPAGMTDKGASYSWAEPAQYFRWVREARNWRFMMESGSASLPPISSIDRFLTNAAARTTGEQLFPLEAAWAHHGANHYFKGYDTALRRLHGEPDSVVDYCWKGHLVTADQHRSMFEAVNHRLWDVTSGFTQWKINTCEPNVQWQLFDYALKPMVSWFYSRKACEPRHVQLNLPDRMVSVINTRLTPESALEVRARSFDRDARLLWQNGVKVDVPANTYRETFTVPETPDATAVWFVKLELWNARGQLLSDNFYWLPGKSADGLKSLQQLPLVKLQSRHTVETHGSEKIVRAVVTNPTDRLAFFIQLAVTKSGDATEVLPALWSDNYFSLLPGESRELTGTITARDLTGSRPAVELGGWNIETPFTCRALECSLIQPQAGEPTTLLATIANTFLDGSRVALFVDGQFAEAKWAWARSNRTDRVPFTVRLSAGQHELRVGRRTIQVTAR